MSVADSLPAADRALSRVRIQAGAAAIPTVLELAVLATIVILALYLRTDRMRELMIVSQDQGRDAMAATDMLRTGQLSLEGPVAAIGTLHRGPAYYYLLAGAYLLSGGDPTGGSLLNVVGDVAALVVAWLLVRSVAGPVAGLTTAGLWSVAPILIHFGRFAWHPPLVLFFGMLALYATLRMVRGDGRWVALLVPAWLVAWQMHEQSIFLLLLIVVVLAWKRPRIPLGWLITAVGLGLVVMAPFIAEQVRTRGRDVIEILRLGLAVITGSGVGAGRQDYVPVLQRPGLALQMSQWSFVSLPGVVAPLMALAVACGIFWLAWRLRTTRDGGTALLLIYVLVPFLYIAWPIPFFGHYLMIDYVAPLILAGVGVGAIAATFWNLRAPLGTWLRANDFGRRGLLAAGRVVTTVAVALVVAGASLGASQSVAATSAEQLSPLRWNIRLEVAREVVASTTGAPYTFRLLSQFEAYDGWRDPWYYALRFAGQDPDEQRVDLPTFVIFDPDTLDGGPSFGGQVIEQTRWVQFPAPTVGPNLLQDASFATLASGKSGPWQTTSAGTVTVEVGTDGAVLRLINPRWSETVNAVQDLPLPGPGRYLMSFEYRSMILVGEPRIYVQMFDANKTLLDTEPNGGGYIGSVSSDWQTGSFYVDAPSGSASVRVWLRDHATGVAWFRNVSLAAVTSRPIPPATWDP